MKKTFVIVLTAILLPVISFAQTKADTLWTRVLGGSSVEHTGYPVTLEPMKTSIAIDKDDNIFIATGTLSSDLDVGMSYGSIDAWVIKLNSKGDTLWTKVFGGSQIDSPMDIVADNNGGCVVVGTTYSDDGSFMDSGHHGPINEQDGFAAFFDKDGNIINIKQYGSKSWTATLEDGNQFQLGGLDGLNAVTATKDGNYMAVGYSNSTDGDLGQFDDTQYWAGWFLKFSPTGKKISSSKISHDIEAPENYLMKLFDVEESDDGKFVALGECASLFGSPFWIVKSDGIDNKNKDWSVLYSSENMEVSTSLTKKNSKTYTVCGWIGGRGGDVEHDTYGYADVWVFDVEDQDGMIGNQNVFGGSDGDIPMQVYGLKNGNVLISGYTYSVDGDAYGGYGLSDFWLLELNDNLDTLITHKIGGSGYDELHGVVESKTGDAFYLAGISTSKDYYVTKNNGETDLWVSEITANPTLDVEDITKKSEIICLPAETKGIFNLRNAFNQKIIVHDVLGKEVLSQTIMSENEQISLQKCGKGIYFISTDDRNYKTLKIIIE